MVSTFRRAGGSIPLPSTRGEGFASGRQIMAKQVEERRSIWVWLLEKMFNGIVWVAKTCGALLSFGWWR